MQLAVCGGSRKKKQQTNSFNVLFCLSFHMCLIQYWEDCIANVMSYNTTNDTMKDAYVAYSGSTLGKLTHQHEDARENQHEQQQF